MGKKWLIITACLVTIPSTFVLTFIQVYYLLLGLNPNVFPLIVTALLTLLLYLPLIAYLFYRNKAKVA